MLLYGLGSAAASDEEDDSPGSPRSRSPRCSSESASATRFVRPRTVRVGLFHQHGTLSFRPRPLTIGASQFFGLQLLCPVTGPMPPLKVPSSITDTDMIAFFQQGMPRWDSPLVPVWPAVSLSTLHFVPAAPQPLVTVLIANQAQPSPRLVLRRSPKAAWERSLGVGYTYKGPVSLDPTASDWADVYLRDGDVFVQLIMFWIW